MSQKIDGKALADKHRELLKKELTTIISEMVQKGIDVTPPTIVSFCNTEDEPSVKYTEMKKQKAEEVGIDFWVENYDTKTPYEDLRVKVEEYNNLDRVNGIMVQLPLPLDLIVFRGDLLNKILPQKDVDGLTEEGQKHFMPATVKSVISILEAEASEWTQKQIGIVGSDGEVGKPLVEVLNSKFKIQNLIKIDLPGGDITQDLKNCDVVISCVGKEGLIKPEMIKDGVVLIDVGLGDFDEGCFEKASKYTGKFGGVGPMTVISLMENVVESFSNR